jgi:hypothetical protein
MIANQPFSIFVLQSRQRQIAWWECSSDSDGVDSKDGLELCLVLLISRVIINI